MKDLIFTRTSIMAAVVILTMLAAGIAAVPRQAFPEVVQLPGGWQPEGIAIGNATDFYVGSLAGGAIYKGDLRTGEGSVLVEQQEGLMAVGLAFDQRSGNLFVAGGQDGSGRVYNSETGELLAEFSFTQEEGTFVNDVVATREAAYFTDSARPVLYRVPLGPGGTLPGPNAIRDLPLTGEWEQVDGFNANGIDATPAGDRLIVVNTATGNLFSVAAATGEAVRINLGEDSVPNGDGILLDGRRLYVVQNFLNQIAAIDLDATYTSGSIVGIVTNENFRIPTTIAKHGSNLYVVNARFDAEPGPTVSYEVVRVPMPPR